MLDVEVVLPRYDQTEDAIALIFGNRLCQRIRNHLNEHQPESYATIVDQPSVNDSFRR